MNFKRILLLSSLCFILYLPSSFLRDFYQPDETRNIYIAQNIETAGDLLVPKYLGENYYQKPPFYFWLIWPFSRKGLEGLPFIVSINIFFALLVILINARVYFQYSKNQDTGFFAGIILASSAIFYVMAGVVRMDMAFFAFVFLSLYFFFLSVEKENVPYALLSGGFSFLACFTKGGLGFFLPIFVELAYLLVLRQAKKAKYLFFSFSSALFFLGMWFFIYYFFVDSNYLQAMVLEQTFQRALEPFTHQRGFWFYAPAFFAAFLPWQFLPWLWGWLIFKKKIKAGNWEKFCFVWLAAGFVLLSFIKSKMVMYLLLLSLPAANLSARALLAGERNAAKLIKISLVGLAVIFTIGVIGFYSKIPHPLAAVFTAAVFLFGVLAVRNKTNPRAFYILFFCWLAVLQVGNFIYQPYISYSRGYKQIRDFIQGKNITPKKIYVDSKKLLPVSIYFPDTPVNLTEQLPEDSFGSIFISRYNIKFKPVLFLGRRGGYNIYYNNAAGNNN